MDAEYYLDQLAEQGPGLLAAAGRSAPADTVPHCPDWTLGLLVKHTTSVYRWVELIVRGTFAKPPRALPEPDPLVDPLEGLAAAQHDVLGALRSSPADLDCWTMWPAGEPRLYWARRMVQETVVHAVDVRNAREKPVKPAVALNRCSPRTASTRWRPATWQRYAATLRSERPTSLGLVSSGTGARWWVRIDPDAPEFGRGAATVDTEVTAGPGELLLLLWNRRGPEGLEVRGDGRALDVWAREAHL